MTNIKEIICNFDSLYSAMWKCTRNVRWKDSVAGFLKNGIQNCINLEARLNNGSYRLREYGEFTVYEPKKREIASTKFVDRVFQRSLCDNYLYNELVEHFIYDNGACLKNKGTDFARGRLQRHLEKYVRTYGNVGYILKIDIKDFFGSADHEKAKRELKKYIRNEFAYSEVCRIIDSFKKGVGLGSQVSQLIMTTLLNRLDHIIKDKLRCKYYVRYMDDLVIISESKEKLNDILLAARNELARLGFRANEKKTRITTLSNGVKFLGFRFKISSSGRVLKSLLKEKVLHERRKIKRQVYLMPVEKIKECFKSWTAHARKANRGKYIIKKLKNQLWRLIKNVKNYKELGQLQKQNHTVFA